MKKLEKRLSKECLEYLNEKGITAEDFIVASASNPKYVSVRGTKKALATWEELKEKNIIIWSAK